MPPPPSFSKMRWCEKVWPIISRNAAARNDRGYSEVSQRWGVTLELEVNAWRRKMGSRIRNFTQTQRERRGHREERIGYKNSPDRGNQFGATDSAVRRNRGKPFNQRSGSDDAIRGIFGIDCRESHRAGTRTSTDGQDDKAGFDFLQEGFEADTKVDAALNREGPHFREREIRDRQAVSEVAGFINRGSCFT